MSILMACKSAPLSESIKFAKEHAVGVEVKSFSSPHFFHSDWQGLVHMVKNLLRNFHNEVSVHGITYPLQHNWDRVKLQTFREEQIRFIGIARELKSKTIILHSTYFPGLTLWKYKDWVKHQADLWGKVADEADKYDITIAIENIIDEKPENLLDVIEKANRPNLKVCLDFGHLNLIQSNYTPTDWIEHLKDHLYYAHFHNNNGRYDSHSELDHGTIDFPAIMEKLSNIPNRPKIAIEVDTFDGIKRSIDFINDSMVAS